LTAPKLAITQLHSEPFVMVLPKTHKLAREKNLTVAHLAEEPFVIYGQRWAPEFYQSWTGICRRAGFTPVVVQETGEMDTALALVSAGLGVGIMPEGVANRRRRVLRIRPLVDEVTRSEIGIAVARDTSDPLRDNLLALAKQVVKR
jgi:DNA-binding transcriptional LysR family regulator